MKYLTAPKGQIVKSRAQHCSLNFKIAFRSPLPVDPTGV